MILRRLLAACTGLALTAVALAQAPDTARLPLRLLFLGEPDSARAADFETSLGARFASVTIADRWAWDRARLADADVVLLDWPQQDGISKWMLAGDRTAEAPQPLGPREAWSKPTVLLGSAGLNLAWAWDVKGAYG